MNNEIVPVETGQDVTLFGAGAPPEVMGRMQNVARALADVVNRQKLYTNIQGKKYVLAEGWTTLAGLLNLSPCTAWTRRVPDYDTEAWEARVEVFHNGQLRGAAEAMCSRDEPRWKDQPSYAIRSMAQTRAMSKALRLPLGFVMKLAGYEATPADEMDGVNVVAHATAGSGVRSVAVSADGAPAAAPAGGVYVNDITVKDGVSAKGPWRKWIVSFSDGQEFGTFDEGLAKKAEALRDNEAPVEIVTEQKGRYVNLVDLKVLVKATDEVASDDLPF